MNQVLLMGNLGRDPELRSLPSGTAVCNFSLATSTRDKENNNITTWHNIVVWGKQAEVCAQALKKGSTVFVDGTLKYRKYDDKEGKTRFVTDIVASFVKFLDKREVPAASDGATVADEEASPF